MGYFFLCRVYIVGHGRLGKGVSMCVEGGKGDRRTLLCGVVIGNMKLLDFLDLS